MRGGTALTLAGLVLFLLVVLVPFWWIASMSFKTYEQIQFATSIYVPRGSTRSCTGSWSKGSWRDRSRDEVRPTNFGLRTLAANAAA
ncbi:MAG TPA: hypothetical protein VGT40_16315 [Methylomirabilota bacterium]|jgi:ABC-type glycerol-3-phosphate transport system permease component|nr:hypothetical protein [Methylomirabilota bacterium]